jgi:hypothetical protein
MIKCVWLCVCSTTLPVIRALMACPRCAVRYYTIMIQTKKEKPMGMCISPVQVPLS